MSGSAVLGSVSSRNAGSDHIGEVAYSSLFLCRCASESDMSTNIVFFCFCHRMDDHDRISQASSVATISYFPVIKVGLTSMFRTCTNII